MNSHSKDAETLHIIHINDVHGLILESDTAIGYAKIAGFVEDFRKKHPDNTLFFDAGDVFQGTGHAVFDDGESLLKILNTLTLDAMTAGNSDYMLGAETLLKKSAALNYPILGNILDKKSGKPLAATEPFTIIDMKNGLRVAVIGITTIAALFGNGEGYEYTPAIDAAKRSIELVRDKADVIIGLIHLGINEADNAPARRLAEAIPEFDIIVDGHSHDLISECVNGVQIVQADSYSRCIGVATLNLADQTVTTEQYHLEQLTDVTPKTETQAEIEKMLERYEKVMSTIVGETAIFLDADRTAIRIGETTMGNLYTDAVREFTGADVSAIPAGMIGGAIEPGAVTRGDMMSILRVSGIFSTVSVTGAQILTALNSSVSCYPEGTGGMLQVSGVKFAFAPARAGGRVVSAAIGGKALEPNAKYVIAVPTAIKNTYSGICDGENIRDFTSGEEILTWYFENFSPVNPVFEGRMRAVGAED